MDCTNARLLLNFVRTGELTPDEREILDSHLGGCSECAAHAQAESRLDEALETAMQRVPVPAGAKTRVLQRLARARRPRLWRWAAAAAVILSAALGSYALFADYPVEFDLQDFPFIKCDIAKLTPEVVEARFSTELGIEMRSPREFNFDLLDNYDTAWVQKRQVAKLTFLARTEQGAALAYVYVMPTQEFKLPTALEEAAAKKDGFREIIPASRHNIQILREPGVADFFYVVVYTSARLDPFTFQGI